MRRSSAWARSSRRRRSRRSSRRRMSRARPRCWPRSAKPSRERRSRTMANEVKLPRLGQGMESGNIVKWLKSEGDTVSKGDPLYELDTDKVTQEVEAPADGVLLKIAVNEGEAAVGSVIAFIGEAGEEVALPEPAAPEAPASTNGASAPEVEAAPVAAETPAQDEAPAAEAAAPSDGGRIKASPLARRIAREKGVE